MVAYPIEEAKALLTEKLSSQRNSMTTCLEDLEFLREQITTMEVNIGTPFVLSGLTLARTYNWDVRRRREAKATTVEDGSDDEKS
jgi:Prefoldin subunit